ncbi:MAG: glycerol-3-phosphate 1-O-acyltransferase PlsY [Candidatus Omnitrophica bacterium]|nr:glycerol-3-phosphate 1-O-acyltransferase PlsY [Candidatus Omnitrophota bacterium]MBU4303395.1 glycerol-3-phosphate 1-O-acyltransferase PlsY [Candidatus Omnitrophota bacterium]MBU4419230.1 glycerol-3-phosphate 1-O-acyltransferase PlsY [Candidatus Omnitrophota bacterium]MBU4468781.1 glycerol-3-phosphate 1-O-acyltransferase PlsY [Candidatus Omnitrophota bacterium]MCG2708068.1 glycerol-3-phosphate 1-O-acyltransferase PlsY [Candidatus Omnitrophota bacterium]
MLLTIAALLISYLIGSIPTAYLFGRVLKGIDIRKVGSGNVGATNALRVLGKGPGITVLIIDILKGLIVVSFLGDYFKYKEILWQVENLRIIMGLCCICGHNWTIFLQFKGGKGIATSLGVLLGLALRINGLNIVIGILITIWFAVFFLFRIVSLASIIAAIGLPAACIFFKQSLLMITVSLVLCILVIIRHKANLLRIFQGKEPRLNFKKSPS